MNFFSYIIDQRKHTLIPSFFLYSTKPTTPTPERKLNEKAEKYLKSKFEKIIIIFLAEKQGFFFYFFFYILFNETKESTLLFFLFTS